MSQIVQAGQLNLTALVVPDLYVQIIPPAIASLNGVPSNVLGIVGTAQWGPVNAPTVFGTMAEFAQTFGQLQNRRYDLGTVAAAAALQGANNFIGVRVTDGTDVAATATAVGGTGGLDITAKYTGSLGNNLQVTLAAGRAANTTKIILAIPGLPPEQFDNIAGTGNALWLALAAAINEGVGGQRGPSNLATATAGASVTAPTLGTTPLTGGLDGTTTITSAVLTGVDGTVRKGMYSLRGTGASIGVLADCADPTTWAAQVAYGLSEGTYMVDTTAAGSSIAADVTAKGSASADSYALKVMHGDWCYWNDPVNQVTRMISPQGFIAGTLANLAPQNSSLNKPIYGIVGTQQSLSNLTYSSADLQTLGLAGIDVIANPIPAGQNFGARFGHNASSNPSIQGDNYTRMTNYLAATFAAGMGQFVGQLQSTQPSDPWRRGVKATLSNYAQSLVEQNQIDSFSIVCDLTNNPPARIALGYGQADVNVRYLSVVEKFIVNMQGGQNVQVATVTQPA